MKIRASVVLSLLLAAGIGQASAAALDASHINQVMTSVKNSISAQHSTAPAV